MLRLPFAGRSAHRLVPLVSALVMLLTAVCGCADPAPPSIVLITLDTTRADHLGTYGYEQARTPNLDRFATQGVVYENGYSTSAWTLPSHASMLTGLLPMQHGAQSAPEGENRSLGYGVRPLGESFTTLAELLRDAGYRTAAVVAGPALRSDLGIQQGFEHYQDDLDTKEKVLNGRRAREVADLAIEMLEGFGETPYFLFVNFFDPHSPYRPPGYTAPLPTAEVLSERRDLVGFYIEQLSAGAPARPVAEVSEREKELIANMLAGYDAEIAYMDVHLGRLLDAIDASKQADRTLLILTADHGESFGEHYFVSHGAHLYEHNVHVPLIVRAPGQPGGRRVRGLVQNHRVFATALAAAGLPIPGNAEPLPLEAGPSEVVLEVHRSDSNIRMFGDFFDRDLLAIRRAPYKRIESSRGVVELFDLERDPAELDNLHEREPARSAELAARLEELRDERAGLFDPSARAKLDAMTEEALRALGYLD